MSYVFWRGPSQLFQMNQIPCPQQRQMGCAFPTARSSFLASQQARQCQKHGLCGVKRAVVAVHRQYLLTSQLCRPPLGLSESLTVPILVLQDSFLLLPKGIWILADVRCRTSDVRHRIIPMLHTMSYVVHVRHRTGTMQYVVHVHCRRTTSYIDVVRQARMTS